MEGICRSRSEGSILAFTCGVTEGKTLKTSVIETIFCYHFVLANVMKVGL
jgi:hypothetical protein